MILLTHGYFLSEDEKEAKIMRPYVPLGILYISAYLKQNNIENQVFDSTFSTLEVLKQNLLENSPKLIGIYTNLMTKINVLKIVQFIKINKLKTKIVLGGPEIRYNADNYLRHGADILVIGEGEETFLELCKVDINNIEDLACINGIAYLNGNKTFFTPERSLIKDINQLPFPAREAIDLKKYGEAWKNHHGYSMYSISTMRGCPYTCKWCSRAVYGGTYRRRSAKLVVDEIELLKNNYSPDRIWFVDDVFTINHKWLREFALELMNRGITIQYEIITRADRMSDEVIDILKKTGCFRVWIGAESGSQEIINAMDRRVEISKVQEMILKTKKTGIEAGTFIMLGYPGERRKNIQETIQHLKTCNPDFFTITVAYPITGTPLYEENKMELREQNNWANQTDRQLSIQGSHSKKYYECALQWVVNDVNFYREKDLLLKIKFKLKSLKAQLKMSFIK